MMLPFCEVDLVDLVREGPDDALREDCFSFDGLEEVHGRVLPFDLAHHNTTLAKLLLYVHC